jgi:sugar lactone lactonase YvrE
VTIAGQKGTTDFKGGTLATATFSNPRWLCVDAENNLYGANWSPHSTYMLNEEKDIVMQLPGNTYAGGLPAIDITGKIVMFPHDGGDGFTAYDADLQWASRTRQIFHPTAEDIAAGKKDFTIAWKQAFTTCELDGMVYTYDWTLGNLVKFDPVSRKGELVATLTPSTHGQLLFHPVEKEILYVGLVHRRAIYTYNILTGEYKHFAGTLGVSGYRDGPVEDALIGEIGQMLFDDNHDIIFSDMSAHCIRKINIKDRIVTTVIGKGGVAGYQDGNPDDALFNQPVGMCIDKNYNIYIADMGNQCIRKLVTQ